ncbi:MAG: hypothetical protein KGQ87_00455 [Verrucomicrobia bacterium]|nr:hypothetical protein [Verrucomicrobiota bacterium]
MRIGTLCKASAVLLMTGLVAFSGAIAYHAFVDSLGGFFEKVVPVKERVAAERASEKLAAVVAAKSVPVIDPGDQFYDAARRLMAEGKHVEAREKLGMIIVNHPLSGRARSARMIVGEMNLDELFSVGRIEGKVFHYMQRGESYEQVAEKCRSNLDCLLSLNPSVDLRRSKEGERLLVLPLDFHFVLEIERKVISAWNGGRFVCEFAVLQLVDRMARQRGGYFIESKVAGSSDLKPRVGTAEYRSATKAIWLARPTLKIQGWDGEGDPPEGAVLLASADMEELFLLTRPGNKMEIR